MFDWILLDQINSMFETVENMKVGLMLENDKPVGTFLTTIREINTISLLKLYYYI